MKKLKKAIFITILAIIILLVILRIKDYIILSKISKVTESLNSSVEPYFIKVTDIDPDGTVFTTEEYAENNIHVSRRINKTNGEIIYKSFSWESLDEKFVNRYVANYQKQDDGKELKTIACIAEDEETLKEVFNEKFVNYFVYTLDEVEIDYQEFWLELRNEIQDKFFYPMVSSGEYKGKECYVFKPFGYNSYMRLYVDKETLLSVATERWNNINNDCYISEYEYLTEAPEGIFEKPNLEEFDEVFFYDYVKENVDTKNKLVADKPISGTNLKAGEMLLENVTLKENEELNFLKLTPNKSGIIEFEIYNLETYNKFREKYSNLRKLTEEDFEAYYVAIAYSLGNKLNYLDCFESKEAWKFNFVVNAEKTNNNTLLLAVIPNESGNRQAIFVESDEKVKINAEQAINISKENEEKISEHYKIEFETYLGYLDDHLMLLTKEKFSELDYIKTPIKGEEKVCWNLHYRVANHETINYIEVYVDAISGNIIGAKSFYK